MKTALDASKVTDKVARVAAVATAILYIVSIIMRGTQQYTRLRTVCEVLFEKAIFGADTTNKVLKEISKKYVRNCIYVPWKRALDLTVNGGFNYNGIEILRSVKELDHFERGFLPSRSEVQRCASRLHELGQQKIPIQKMDCELGELFAFDYEKLLRFILNTFLLHEIAQQESFELCIMLDGAEICKDLSHLTFGIKITDARAIDPRDGTPLAHSQDGIFGNLFKVQSRNYCIAMKTLLGKDSQKAYQEFRDVFDFFEKVRKGLSANENGPTVQPLEIWSPQDLSNIWKCLNTGCGAKKTGKTQFCHLCACTENKIGSFQIDENRCQCCIAKNCHHCFH